MKIAFLIFCLNFAMASSAVTAAAKQISKLLVDEAKYLYAVKGKVEALHDELTWMRSFLQDADSREQDEELIRLWVSQIRDFAYEAEDIVEKYVHRVSRHRQDDLWNTVKWFSCICCDFRAHHEIGSDLDGLKQKISDLCSRMQIYGVKNKSRGNPNLRGVMELRRSNSQFHSEEIVVLREDTDKLVEMLIGSDYKVICVSGMGGLGKTTLAKMVYADLKPHFDARVWVYVSQQFQISNIFKAILIKLGYINDRESTSINDLRDEDLPSKVCEVLLEKKCLVVLDDVWNDEDWKKLAPAFATLRRSSKSRLLLTTRMETLLSRVDNRGHHHKARKLTMDESWQLLETISTRGNPTLDDERKRLGKEMSVHCDGLPLALVVLGGILAAKTSIAEWEKVKDNIDTVLKNTQSDKDGLRISKVLELSYCDLPYYLKPCFLHLANFPEDYEIPTKTLYHMWAIEGVVAQPTYTVLGEQASLEAVANGHLQELVDRCLVELCQTGKKGMIKSCRLHDLVRDMCLRKSKEENFLHVIKHGDFNIMQSSNSPVSHTNRILRRLAIYMHKNGSNLQDLIPADHNTGNVRSLLLFPVGDGQRRFKWPKGTVSKALRLVRILSFEDICIRSLPSEIGELVHLRYLNLKGTRVSKLPWSISKLKYLEILDLQVSESIDVSIPNVICKLQKLKHLYLPTNWKMSEDEIPILNQLYPGVPILGKLRLAGLSQLETLVNLRLKDCRVKDMLELKALQKVTLADYSVTENECLKSFLRCPNIAAGKLKKPLSLVVDGSVISKDPSILASNSLLRFHKLEISGKVLIRLDYARIFPLDLEKLSLNQCELQDDPMPILEKLHHLKELTLGEKSFSGNKMACTSENFPKLAVLRLVQLENLGDWTVEEGAMPCLESLYMYSCQKLIEIPSELPYGVKIGCRPCIQRHDRYGDCYYSTLHETGA